MLEGLEKQRSEVRTVLRNGVNFNIGKSLCVKYINEVQMMKLSFKDSKEDFWFGYYNQAYCDKKMEDLKEAYINAQKSIQYTEFDSDDYKYSYSLWLIGQCTLELNYKVEAIKIFSECGKLFKEKKDERFRLLSLFNIALAHKSIHMMNRIIRIYENNNLNATLPTYGGDMQKDEILYEMYSNLIRLHKNNDDYISAFNILHKINNKYLKKELSKLLIA